MDAHIVGQGRGFHAGFGGHNRRSAKRLWRKFGNDAASNATDGFQLVQLLAQPAGMTDGHPDRTGCLCRIGLQCAVQFGHVVQHTFFQQPFQHGAQARRICGASLGQLHAVPGKRLRRNQRHDLIGILEREQCSFGMGVPVHRLAIRTQDVGKRCIGGSSKTKADKELGHESRDSRGAI